MSHGTHHHEASGTADELATCPVMEIAVNKKEAVAKGLVRTVNNKTYYLCCNTCAQQFDADPERYTEEEL